MSGASKAIRLYLFNSVIQSQELENFLWRKKNVEINLLDLFRARGNSLILEINFYFFFNTYMARRWMFAPGIGEKRGEKSMVYHNFDYLCSRFLVGRRDIPPVNRSDKRLPAGGNKKKEIRQAQNQCQAIKVSARGFFLPMPTIISSLPT